MRHLHLRNLFELRKVHSMPERTALGRVFFRNEKMGLADATGCLWPLVYKGKNKVLTGDIIVFKCHIQNKVKKNSPTTASKYEDDCSLIEVTEILQKVTCQTEWNDAPTLSNSALHSNNTFYFPAPNAEKIKLISARNRSIERTRQFFLNRSFLNIETPTLVPSGGIETYLHPFTTEYEDHRGNKWKLELPTSPEFALKKILVEGVEKIFQLSRSYRNKGELSDTHEPEFTMLEWYRTGASLAQIMHDIKSLVLTLADVLGSVTIQHIPENWPIFRVDQLFASKLSLQLEKLQNRDDFYHKAKKLSPSIAETDEWNDIFCKLFMEKIEPFLKEQGACFVTHYPIQQGALAMQEGNKPYVERCEAFLFGVEISNAYLELLESNVLKQRFAHVEKQRPDIQRDSVFEEKMEFGLPPCAGCALGIDRVIALLLGIPKISALYAIPFLSQFPKDSVASE